MNMIITEEQNIILAFIILDRVTVNWGSFMSKWTIADMGQRQILQKFRQNLFLQWLNVASLRAGLVELALSRNSS